MAHQTLGSVANTLWAGSHHSRQHQLTRAEQEILEALDSGVGPDELELALLEAWDDFQTPPKERARVVMWLNALRTVTSKSQGYRSTLRDNLEPELQQKRRSNRWSTQPHILQGLVDELYAEGKLHKQAFFTGCLLYLADVALLGAGAGHRFESERQPNNSPPSKSTYKSVLNTLFAIEADIQYLKEFKNAFGDEDFRDAYSQARRYQQQYENYRSENPTFEYRTFTVGRGGCKHSPGHREETTSHYTYHARHPEEPSYTPHAPRSTNPGHPPNVRRASEAFIPNNYSYHTQDSRPPYNEGYRRQSTSHASSHPRSHANPSPRVPHTDGDPWTEFRDWQQRNEKKTHHQHVRNNDARTHYSYEVEEAD
ncbi:hypothetical protein F5884DRAFT_747859 [Xylogone sp. PMI_703]|nr:hypothetical protein F5884DRAFT_747859 [Xylogone sp. PMI_703]